MSSALRHAFQRVLVYIGHRELPQFSPYAANTQKRIEMFQYLNQFRKKPWNLETVAGEELAGKLQTANLEETLLVIPAGQSSHFDKAFSVAEAAFLKSAFYRGLRGYVTCGSAYWTAKKRVYHGFTTENSTALRTQIKSSALPLFPGVAEGPLCPFPGASYKVGFYSDAVEVTDGTKPCTIYLSGGGTFHLPPDSRDTVVVARYQESELQRLGKKGAEAKKWQNAAVMTRYGKGALLSAMFHPYYGKQDFDVQRYENAFPGSGTDWKAVHQRLSSLDDRMALVTRMLERLELMDFSK